MIQNGLCQYWWDAQIGTFMAQIGGVVHGTHSGQYLTAADLANATGNVLSTVEIATLDAEKLTEPQAAILMLSKTEFLNRFTITERAAILSASKSYVQLEVFLFDLQNADSVHINSQQTINSVLYLESVGLLGNGRAYQILGITL